jgi:DNA-binding FadR family transcriptional regulator
MYAWSFAFAGGVVMPRTKEKPRVKNSHTTSQLAERTGNEGAIWSRIMGARPAFSPAVARSILELQFSPEDQARMRDLAAKARAGSLNPEEQVEIESYSRVGSILGLMKSKARVSLKKNSQT